MWKTVLSKPKKQWQDFWDELTQEELDEMELHDQALMSRQESLAEQANEAHLYGHDDYGYAPPVPDPDGMNRLKKLAKEYNDTIITIQVWVDEDDVPF